MEVRVVAPELRKLDRLDVELLVVLAVAGERPMRSVAGLIDWRLAGGLSRALARGRIGCEVGRRTLLSVEGKLPCRRLLLVGGGTLDVHDLASANRYFEDAFRAADALEVRRLALALPASLGDASDAWLEALARVVLEPHEVDSLVLVDAGEDGRAWARAIDSVRRRVRMADVP